MPSSPLTIVIPVYNRAHTIGRTLRSIESQTVRPARVILIDNNSSDTTLSLLHDWASVHHDVTVLTEPRPGACAARNRGLREVTTEWTMFFDSDDEMLPTHVEEFTRAITDHPDADVIGRDIILQSLDGSRRRMYFKAGKDAMFHHLFRGCLSTQRYVARTSLFRRVGGWNERLTGWNDFELGVRILLTAPVILRISRQPTVIVYQQEQSITGTNFSSHPERWEDSLDAIRQLFVNLPGSHPCKRRYICWLDARSMILAARYEREARVTDSRKKGAESVETTGPRADGPGITDARALARSLHDRIISISPLPAIMHLIYLHNLTFSRLTWPLVKILL